MSRDSAELMDIPVSFEGPGRLALGVVMTTLLVLVVGGTFAPVNSGAIAPGEVIPAGHSKLLQHLEGGVIRRIAVRDGTRVKAGQELLLVDDTEASSALAIAAAEESAMAALVARLEAERDGGKLPPLPEGSAGAQTQAKLFEARRIALLKELTGLQTRIDDAKRELAGWEGKNVHLKQLLANAEEESRNNRDLFERKFISRSRLLQLDSHIAETEASLAENRAEEARAKQKITDAEVAIAKLRNDWLSNVLDELRKAQDAHATAKERLEVARSRLARTRVVAPSDGTVNNLRFTTEGGVIPPGGAILEITPGADRLVVEAHLSPDDIDTVRPGLPARVRLSAYKARWHFALKGEVAQVSSDTFKDERSGRTFYKVRVEIPDGEMRPGEATKLVPGMLAQVEIVTGERAALRYLLDPIIGSLDRAMKEK